MALHHYYLRWCITVVDWDSVINSIKGKLTKKQRELLRKAIDDYGDPEDFIVDVVRKAIDPDLLSVSDIEICITKAMKVGAYVGAMGNNNNNNINSIVNDVVNEAYSSDTQQSNSNPLAEPLKQIGEMIKQQITAEVTAKFQQMLGNITPTATQSGNNNGGNSIPITPTRSRSDNDGSTVFTGDE